jgi:hypothetical protein
MPTMSKFTYAVVPGHFVQDEEPEDISKDVVRCPSPPLGASSDLST